MVDPRYDQARVRRANIKTVGSRGALNKTFLIMYRKPYIPPSLKHREVKRQNVLNLLVELSVAGNISDWKAGNTDDLYEDD